MDDDSSPRIEEIYPDGEAQQAPPPPRQQVQQQPPPPQNDTTAAGSSSDAAEAPVTAAAPADVSDGSMSEEAAAMLEDALALKARGNEHFKRGENEPAIQCYTEAIAAAPPSAAKERATFFANRAACHAKLREHSNVIDDCTSCLELDDTYTKAYLRRAAAREALNLPTEALDDAKRAAELDPASKEATSAVARLEKASAAKLEEQKEEMLGKLKDLGNSVLGRFGMSLDNFKAEKDPNTGSYNISFQR